MRRDFQSTDLGGGWSCVIVLSYASSGRWPEAIFNFYNGQTELIYTY